MHKLIVTLRSRLLVFLTHHMALPLLQLIRKPQKFPYTGKALRQLPKGTLGRQLIEMLDKKGSLSDFEKGLKANAEKRLN